MLCYAFLFDAILCIERKLCVFSNDPKALFASYIISIDYVKPLQNDVYIKHPEKHTIIISPIKAFLAYCVETKICIRFCITLKSTTICWVRKEQNLHWKKTEN